MKKWDIAITSVLVVCALVTTGLVIRREFFAPANTQVGAAEEPRYVKDWRAHLNDGMTLGSAQSPVQLIEFADFECPFCATFHNTVKQVEEQFPGKIAVTFVHFPLPGHRFAEPAARVAQCAADQGRFEAMHDQLFANQNAFGLKPWSEFARAAGVPDLNAFETCVNQETEIQRVAAGKKAGEDLDVRGTPTIIINGWKLAQPPGPTQLKRMVQAILQGKNPVD
jgi:protein-disulfide isomerase